jgi:hypothetical protein
VKSCVGHSRGVDVGEYESSNSNIDEVKTTHR